MAHFYKLIITVWLAVFACETFSAAIPLTPGSGVAFSSAAGGWTTAAAFDSTVTPFGSSSLRSMLKGGVASTAVEIPAQWGLASKAPSIALQAVRLAPQALFYGAVATWLAQYGLEWVEGQWKKKQTFEGNLEWCGTHSDWCQGGWAISKESACNAYAAWYKSVSGTCTGGVKVNYRGTVANNGCVLESEYCPGAGSGWVYLRTASLMSRNPENTSAVATEADFEHVNSALLMPDDAANDLAKKGVALPLKNPVPEGQPYKDVAIGAPYIDPVTGKRYQDYARITPSADGQTAKVETFKQEIDSAGNPATNSTTGQPQAPEKPDPDMCEKNPEASGCKPLDEVPDSELKNKDVGLSLVPVPGFGPSSGSCPSPQALFSAGGQAVTWDWQSFCSFSLGIRPVVLAFAWLAAIMIVVGVARRGS